MRREKKRISAINKHIGCLSGITVTYNTGNFDLVKRLKRVNQINVLREE
jgi:hypothetical protein